MKIVNKNIKDIIMGGVCARGDTLSAKSGGIMYHGVNYKRGLRPLHYSATMRGL